MPYTFLTPVNMAGLEVRDVRAETVGGLPTADATQAGRYVYHSGQLKYCNGSAWIVLGAEGAGGPPSGTASGDLTGSYPGPQIAAGVIVDADVNASANIAQAKIANLTTDLAAKVATTVDLTAGNGLTGGGTLAANRTFAVGAGTGITVNADDVAVNPSAIALSAFAVPTGPVAMNNQKITGLGTPTADTDAATKAYADTTAQGLDAKASVRCASLSTVTLATHGAIDGVTPTNGQRVLLKNQSTAAENGIYVSNGTALSRAPDMDTWAEVPSAYVWVEEGSQQETGWVCTNDQTGTLGSTTITWVQFSGAGQITAGAGLTKTGSTIDVVGDATLTVSADSITVASAPKWTTARSFTLTGDVTGTVASVDGSANVSIATTAVGAGTGSKHFAANVGAGTAVVVNHALATRDVSVEVYRNSTPWDTVLCDVERTDTNNVTLRFAVSVAANAYRCVVQGR